MVCTNDRVNYGPMIIFVCLHFILPHNHHYADVSRSIELLKYSISYILLSVCLRLYEALCIQLTHFYYIYDDCENMSTLILFSS